MKTRKILERIVILLAILTVIAIGAFIAIYQQDHHEEPVVIEQPIQEEEVVEEFVTRNIELEAAFGIPITHAYIPYESPRRPKEIRAIKYITIHETDNRSTSATALGHSNFLLGDTNDITSWHYTVDDKEIYHHVPDNEVAYNAGDNRERDGGNINGIGIEMCVNLGGDYEKTLDNTAALTATLLHVYDLTVEDVRLHADFMDKICPHRLITEGRVDEFMEKVRTYYEQEE